jgi:hypothetical protein
MATLLIETKEVKALQVNIDDLQALLSASYNKPVEITGIERDRLLDVGKYRVTGVSMKALDGEIGKDLPISFIGYAIQEMVNRDELPEGHYLLDTALKQDEFADGGTVKSAVIELQAQIASAHYGEAVV